MDDELAAEASEPAPPSGAAAAPDPAGDAAPDIELPPETAPDLEPAAETAPDLEPAAETAPDLEPAPEPVPDSVAVQPRRRRRRLRAVLAAAGALLLVLGGGSVAEAVYYDGVRLPSELYLDQQTTLYYSDGHTVLARSGGTRRLVRLDDLPPAVPSAVVAAQDPGFLTDSPPWLWRLVRAQVAEVTGSHTSTDLGIAEQYSVMITGGNTGRIRAAALAGRLEAQYTKRQILEFYLNTAYFGRAAYGIEAAAQAYFGKSAAQLSASEAMVLGGVVDAGPGHADVTDGDPTEHPDQARARWEQTRQSLASAGTLDAASLAALAYPGTAIAWTPSVDTSFLKRPTGLVVSHVMSELQGQLHGVSYNDIVHSGWDIITTIDATAQQAVEAAADRTSTGSLLAGQPANLAAAAVVVQPGTGRVLAYFGGPDGTGADEAGWFYDRNGDPSGRGFHAPGETFTVYTLAAGLAKGVSLLSWWDAHPSVSFPDSGRTVPVRNAALCPTHSDRCSLLDSFRAGLATPFFALTLKAGVKSVLTAAGRAGIDTLLTDTGKRIDLTRLSDPVDGVGNEAGIGQYPVTVLDQANAMATYAARGERAPVHFVQRVSAGGKIVYSERLTTTSVGLNLAQLGDLTYAMQAQALAGGRPVASRNGSWQLGPATGSADTWTVGFTGQLGIAVWVGSTDGTPARSATGSLVYGFTFAEPAFRRIATDISSGLHLPVLSLPPPGNSGDPAAGNTPGPDSGNPHPGSTPSPG